MDRNHTMATAIKQPPPVNIPPAAGKKARARVTKSPDKGFFGLLPDWKIDSQALKNELRD